MPHEKLVIRKARYEDLPFIKECIARFKLDNENLENSQFIVIELNDVLAAFGRIKHNVKIMVYHKK